MPIRAKIISTGSFVPEKVLTNRDLEQMLDTTDEWITERSGIKERRVCGPDEAASDLAYGASRAALKSAGLKAKELDLIIVATVTSDMPFPSTGCVLQKRLGAKKAVAFDINAACSGFVFALSNANAYIRSGLYEKVLVVGTETLSKFLDWQDRSTCVLFGDAAGAVILEPSDSESGIVSVDIYSDGSYVDMLNIPGGGSRVPPTCESVQQGLHFIKMKGNETFKVAVKTLEKLVVDTLKKNNLKSSDLALLIPHQANMRIIQAVAKRLKLPMDKVVVNIDRFGNTSSASVPLALDEAVRTGRVRKGDYILVEAFGGGLTWGSALIKW